MLKPVTSRIHLFFQKKACPRAVPCGWIMFAFGVFYISKIYANMLHPQGLFPKSGFRVLAVVMREHGVRPLPSLIFSPKCLTLLDTFRFAI